MKKLYKKIKNWFLLKKLKKQKKKLEQKVDELFSQKKIADALKERKVLLRLNKRIKNLKQ